MICAATHGPLRTRAQHGPAQPQCGSRPVTGVELLPSYLTQSCPVVTELCWAVAWCTSGTAASDRPGSDLGKSLPPGVKDHAC